IERSLSLTTKILNGLVEEGYVVETGFAPSSGGRRAQMYSLKHDIMYIVSVAMDQFITRLVVMDMQNRHVGEILSIEIDLSASQNALNILTDKINEVVDSSGIERSKFLGIGIGMPGFIDAKNGVNYSFLEQREGNLTSFIENKTGIPVHI